jgi:hypothetical protein
VGFCTIIYWGYIDDLEKEKWAENGVFLEQVFLMPNKSL